MSDESPIFVSLPASFDLSDFPSEADETASEPSAEPPRERKPLEIRPNTEPTPPREEAAGPPQLATVTDFPVPASKPAASGPTGAPAPSPTAVSLVELLERQGGLDWRHAVSVVHQLCLQ